MLGKRNSHTSQKSILGKILLRQSGNFFTGHGAAPQYRTYHLQDPSLLLLDEPCTGLDKESQELFYAVIQEFQAKNAAILWVSHNPQEDMRCASHMLHIEKQQIAFTKIQGALA